MKNNIIKNAKLIALLWCYLAIFNLVIAVAYFGIKQAININMAYKSLWFESDICLNVLFSGRMFKNSTSTENVTAK